MGSRTRLSVFATLEGSDRVTPAELEAFVGWVRAAERGEPQEPEGFPIDGALAGMVDAAAELLAHVETHVRLAPAWQRRDPRTSTEWTVWDLSVQAIEGDDPIGAYAVALLVAPFAAPGLVGTISREYFDDPTFVFSQGGVAFMANRGGVPRAVTNGDEVPWQVDHERPSADDYRRFGIPDAEGLATRAKDEGEPLLARHLLGRTVLRALRDRGLGDAAPPRSAGRARRDRRRWRPVGDRRHAGVAAALGAGTVTAARSPGGGDGIPTVRRVPVNALYVGFRVAACNSAGWDLATDLADGGGRQVGDYAEGSGPRMEMKLTISPG